MAGQSRTLKLSILADVDQLKKSLNTGSTQVDGFTSNVDKFSSKAKLAFAAAGVAAAAYAGKLLIDGVKSAIADEAAQVRLANALRNTVGATDEAIASAEKYILKQALATGVSDDELRPALERLTRSTKDIAEAQKLTNLALDIAKAKNIDVATVANALAKANDGQVGALKKLGITLGDNATNLKDYNAEQTKLEKLLIQQQFVLETTGSKSKEYAAITEKVGKTQGVLNELTMAGIDVFGELGKEFAGAAAQSADTFQGKLARLNIAFEEGKETIGAFVLDAITPLVSFIVNRIVPAVETFINKLSGNDGLKSSFSLIYDSVKNLVLPIFEGLKSAFDKIKKAISDNSDELQPFYDALAKVWDFIKRYLAPLLGGTFKVALEVIGTLVGGLVTGFSKLVGFITSTVTKMKEFVNFVKDNPVTRFFGGGDNSKGLKAGVNEGSVYSGIVNWGEGVIGTRGGNGPFTPTGIISPATGADIGVYSPAMQAAILRREELKAETERLRKARADAAAARAAATGGLSGAERVVINVNAASVIDEEGFNRAVVDALNNSYYRGTGGATGLVAI
jgi:hypothetical protein